MPTIKDQTGKPWEIEIDVATARRIKSRTGVSVNLVFEPATMQRLHEESDTVIPDIVWAIVEPQANARGLTMEELYCVTYDGDETIKPLFGGDTIADATDAFFEAVVEYYPPQKKTAAKKVLATLQAAGAKIESHGLERLDALNITETAGKIADAVIAKLTPKSTDSPQS